MKGFGQTFPPNVNSYADSVGTNYANLYLSFSPNDTGTIEAQIQLAQGTGNIVYDSTYTIPAGDTNNVELQMPALASCNEYELLINMSNAKAQGPVINPLITFSTICTASVSSINENSYAVIVYQRSVEVKTSEVPQNGTIQIYDVTGRQIINTRLNQSAQQIPFDKNAGIYLLRITGNGQSLYTNRFVIN